MFVENKAAQGVLHVQDALGVSFTLVQGSSRGMLIDTGYGLEDVRAYADAKAAVPYDVILTHGHHDHILGAACFERVWLCGEDREEYLLRSGWEQRQKIADRAEQAGIPVPPDYLSRRMPEPSEIQFPGRRGRFENRIIDLGGDPACARAYTGQRSDLSSGGADAADRGQLESLHVAMVPQLHRD